MLVPICPVSLDKKRMSDLRMLLILLSCTRDNEFFFLVLLMIVSLKKSWMLPWGRLRYPPS